MDITEVLQRVRAGDRQAYAAVVTRYEAALFGFLGRMGLTPARAEEVAQETFVRAWTRLADFDSRRGAFSTWLFTIAKRLALDELTRAANRQELPAMDGHDPASCDPQPMEALALEERRQRLHAALSDLSEADRCVIALVYIEGLALADVARIEKCTTGAVKTRLHRARRRLAKLLEHDDV